ncbi:MAG: ROK family protein [Jatrophihabitantaceae bacterium]
MSALVPVLEVGGTHVTAALVDTTAWTASAHSRLPLDSNGHTDSILDTLGRAGAALGVGAGRPWGVAMPDPFDYPAGIGRFHGVGKFEALDGVDVRAALDTSLPRPARIAFINDADAFAVGEAQHGAGRSFARCVGLTLGTGVGSGWVVDGQAVADGPGVPPGGRIHLATADGGPLEDTMSRRAIRRAYAARTDDAMPDVREIAARARDGEAAAIAVLSHALSTLGEVIGPRLDDFAADGLVIGGSMSASWDLFEPWLRKGLGADAVVIVVSADTERAALLGAAQVALRP